MRGCLCLLCSILVLGFAGCPGSIDNPFDSGADRDHGASDLPTYPDSQWGGDDAAADHGAEGGASDGPGADAGCTATGVAKGCDPVSDDGCSAGSCYLLPVVGTACVCPAGQKAAGGTCNTTGDCVPGHGCAGATPPGNCRRLCATGAPTTCLGTEQCTPIEAFPAYGACMPK